MSIHLKTVEASINDTIKKAIEDAIEDAQVEVAGSGGHFTISVVAPFFEGLNMLKSQRAVLQAIKHLMDGPNAPVHAVDSLTTRTP
jgi:acid stress-induced BolA-like protein IbaG/YrbA